MAIQKRRSKTKYEYGSYWRELIRIIDTNGLLCYGTIENLINYHLAPGFKCHYFKVMKRRKSNKNPAKKNSDYLPKIKTIKTYSTCKKDNVLDALEFYFNQWYDVKNKFIDLRSKKKYKSQIHPYFSNNEEYYHYLYFKDSPEIISYLTKNNTIVVKPEDYFNDDLNDFTNKFSIISDIYCFRSIIQKTWGKQFDEVDKFSKDEFNLLNKVINAYKPTIENSFNRKGNYLIYFLGISWEKSSKIYAKEKMNLLYTIIGYMILDFLIELDDSNRIGMGYHRVDQCRFCGNFYSYDLRSQNQKYCSKQCKNTFNKRNQREREKSIKK